MWIVKSVAIISEHQSAHVHKCTQRFLVPTSELIFLLYIVIYFISQYKEWRTAHEDGIHPYSSKRNDRLTGTKDTKAIKAEIRLKKTVSQSHLV